MSLKHLPSYRDYWSNATDFHDHYISKLMPMNRFGWLLSHLHFNDNSLQPKRGAKDYDKLYKIRPLLNCLSETFKKAYRPHQNLAVDESMVKFKGRSSMKQYMQNKPIKHGFKIWMLCDQSGYNLKFEIYTGKTDNNVIETGLGAKVVLNLMNELVGKNHIVYMDNYFSSYNLYEILKQNNIYAVGTVNSNRKNLAKLLNDKKLSRGDFDWSTSNTNITMCKWKDKRNAVEYLHAGCLRQAIRMVHRDENKRAPGSHRGLNG